MYSTVQWDTNPLLSNELICVQQNNCILWTDKTHCSFSSFFNPLGENEGKKISTKDWSNTAFLDSREEVKNWGSGNTAQIPRQVIKKSCLNSHTLQPWNVRRLEPTLKTMMAGEQDNLWIAGLVSEFRVDSTHFSSGKSFSLPTPWSSKAMGLQQSLTRTDIGTW